MGSDRGGKARPGNHAVTAALLGGAAAAAAGAVLTARAVARRKATADGPLNPIMEMAVTASQVAPTARKRTSVPREPSVPTEPSAKGEPPVRG